MTNSEIITPPLKTTTTTTTTSLDIDVCHNDNEKAQIEATQQEPHQHCLPLLSNIIWPGFGLLSESYVLFSMGTLQPIWNLMDFSCENCALSVLVGILMGMIVIGITGSWMGRRQAALWTALCMWMGITLWTVTSFSILQSSWLSIALFVFGVGVGGEYPTAACLSSERQERSKRGRGQEMQLVFSMQGVGILMHCVLLWILLWVFQQDHHYINDAEIGAEDQLTLLWIWRIINLIGWLLLTVLLIWRWNHLTESKAWLLAQEHLPEQTKTTNTVLFAMPWTPSRPSKQQSHQQQLSSIPAVPPSPSIISTVSSLSAPSVTVRNVEQYASSSLSHERATTRDDDDDEEDLRYWQTIHEMPSTDEQDDGNKSKRQPSYTQLLIRHYGSRLLGTSLCWLLWDISFYGNKLFQSTFLLALHGDNDDNNNATTLNDYATAAVINAAIALTGYWTAAALVDTVGRQTLQQAGFCITAILLVATGFLLERQRQDHTVLLLLYVLSSYFGQVGPNATTFILAAEVFPTQIRSSGHGISAAAGKVGAVLAALVFQQQQQDGAQSSRLFLLSGYASFAACAVSFWLIPETTGLDLEELDRKWSCITSGNKNAYKGLANHPRFLSYWERQQLQQKAKNEDSHHYDGSADSQDNGYQLFGLD